MTVTKFATGENVVPGEGVNGPYEITETLKGAEAATAANYGIFYTATRKVKVIGVKEVHRTAGSDAGAVTLNVERLQGTEAKDAGDDLLSAGLNLKGTAETVQSGSLITTEATKVLEVGDRLGLVTTGVLTAVAHVSVTVLVEAVD